MDSVTRAAAQISRERAAASVKGAHCTKCDSYLVAWVQSKRTGKWYLADALIGTPGKVIPMAHRPHFLTCSPKPVRTLEEIDADIAWASRKLADVQAEPETPWKSEEVADWTSRLSEFHAERDAR